MPQQSLIVITVEENPELTLDEIAHTCNIPLQQIHAMIEYGIVEPKGWSEDTWRFTTDHLRRIRTITNLQKDLEINLPGAALVLDLIDQMEKMRTRIELFERLYGVK
jgi:chaperone modulatory protein CbpM